MFGTTLLDQAAAVAAGQGTGAELHLAWHAFTLEVTDHGAQHFVITRVQACLLYTSDAADD